MQYSQDNLGACHHSMARPPVADRGTTSNMEGSCEYIEKAVAHSRQGVVLQLRGWEGCEKVLNVKTYRVTKYNLVHHTWIDPL